MRGVVVLALGNYAILFSRAKNLMKLSLPADTRPSPPLAAAWLAGGAVPRDSLPTHVHRQLSLMYSIPFGGAASLGQWGSALCCVYFFATCVSFGAVADADM